MLRGIRHEDVGGNITTSYVVDWKGMNCDTGWLTSQGATLPRVSRVAALDYPHYKMNDDWLVATMYIHKPFDYEHKIFLIVNVIIKRREAISIHT